jgi:hypothetical protein
MLCVLQGVIMFNKNTHLINLCVITALYLLGLLDGLLNYSIEVFNRGFVAVTLSTILSIVYMVIAVCIGLFSEAYSSRVDLTVKIFNYRFNIFLAVGNALFYASLVYFVILNAGYIYLFITRVLI